MSKKGLGKGLGALIPEIGPVDRDQITEVALARIRPNPRQPRKQFNHEKLTELAASIQEHGIVQPLVVRPEGDGYLLVAGERRWRAAKLAGLERVPVVVRQLTAAQVMEIALIENLQREDLSPVEEAEAYKELIEEFGLSQEELARRLGKSRPQISNTLRLLQLPAPVREQVAAGQVSMGHAKVLLAVEDERRMVELARRVVDEGLSVRDLEQAVTGLRGTGEARPVRTVRPNPARNPDHLAVEMRLRELLGTPVKLVPGSPRGKIEIYFYGEEDLTRLADLLMGQEEQTGKRTPRPPAGPFTV